MLSSSLLLWLPPHLHSLRGRASLWLERTSCSFILYLRSRSGAVGQGCPAEYKESNLHILRSSIRRKKICTWQNFYFKHISLLTWRLKQSFLELFLGLILPGLPNQLPANQPCTHGRLAFWDLRARDLPRVPPFCSLFSCCHSIFLPFCLNASS